jgi:DNA-binding NarL/FixJ family response regulator
MEREAVSVLIADDHQPTRADVRRAIETDVRFRVCAEAADAAGAVDAALRQRPEICLLDIRMPGSGLSAAWEIRSRLPNATLVMLTVSEDEHDLTIALRAGVAGYLLKSIDRRRLPLALWDIHQGTLTIPRALMGKLVEQLRGSDRGYRSLATDYAAPRLTSREWQVLELLARGYSTRRAAASLSITSGGVRVHAASVVKKLGVRDREEAIAAFRRARGD